MRPPLSALLLAVLGTGACSFDLNTNPNSPDPMGANPTRLQVAVAATGMLIVIRTDVARVPLHMGIIGREVLRFDGSEPRYTSELLHGPLDPGGFGSALWPYSAIRGGNVILAVLPTADVLTVEEKSATSGYVKTILAFDYLIVLTSHTQDSIPIVSDTSVTAEPAAFQSNAAAFDHVVALLEEARSELAASSAAFPFPLPAGFAGFDTPAKFVRFNRALRARVAVYRDDFAGALTALSESFLIPGGDLALGVYMDFGTGPGDFANPLSLDPQQGENFGHPSLASGVQFQLDGITPDARFTAKLVERPMGSADDLSSDLGWIRYPTPNTPIPIIRNEELILLRAEALIGQGNLAAALLDINDVRVRSGNLPSLAALTTPSAALDELLYNKLYSLMFEGGHRWIDARHYGRLGSLPIDRTGRPGIPDDVVFATLPIPRGETLPR